MKRILCLMTLIPLLLLASCGESTAVSYDSDPDFYLFSGTDCCSTDEVFYFEVKDKAQIRVYDKSSGASAPLCSKPECSHGSKQCNAYYTGNDFCLYGGELYWVDDRIGGTSLEVSAMSKDGTNRRTVMTVEDELYKTNWASGSPSNPAYIFHRGSLYFGGTVGTVSDGTPIKTACLMAYPLDSGKSGKLIYSAENARDFNFHAKGDKLYICAEFDDRLEVMEYWASDGTLKTIYSGSMPFEGLKFRAFDTGIYFADSSERAEVYRLDFDGNMEKVFDFNDGEDRSYYLYGFCDDRIIGGCPDGANFYIKLKELSGKEVVSSELINQDIESGEPLFYFPIGSDEDCLYVRSSVWAESDKGEYFYSVNLKNGNAKLLENVR